MVPLPEPCEASESAHGVMGPLSSKCGTYNTVKTGFWPWLSRQSPSNRLRCALCVRKVVHRVSSSLLGPVDPSFRALSGRLKFIVRRHKFNKDSLFENGIDFAQEPSEARNLEEFFSTARSSDPTHQPHTPTFFFITLTLELSNTKVYQP